jgi:hypothetical protein
MLDYANKYAFLLKRLRETVDQDFLNATGLRLHSCGAAEALRAWVTQLKAFHRVVCAKPLLLFSPVSFRRIAEDIGNPERLKLVWQEAARVSPRLFGRPFWGLAFAELDPIVLEWD